MTVPCHPGEQGETWHQCCLPDSVGPQGRSGWLSLVVCLAYIFFPGVTAERLLSPPWSHTPPGSHHLSSGLARCRPIPAPCAGLGAHTDDCQATGRGLCRRRGSLPAGTVPPRDRPVCSPHSFSCTCMGGDRRARLSGPPAPCPRSLGTLRCPLCLLSSLRVLPCPGHGGNQASA